MLSRLKVANFKALRDVDLRLRGRNIFIGPNKSGKSSILEVLQILTRLMNGEEIVRPLSGELGFQQLLWKGDSENRIRVDIWGDDHPMTPAGAKPIEFRYSVEFGLDAMKTLCITSEFLAARIDGYENEKVLVQAREGKGVAKRGDGQSLFEDPQSRTKPFLAYEVPGWEGNQIRAYIAQWQFFNLTPQLPKITPAPPTAQSFLEVSGANLSSWLHTFQSNFPEDFNRVVAVAKEAFSEIESISVPVSQAGTTFLSTKERGLHSPVSVFYASEGEIKFLQLMSIIFSPFRVGLVAVEEPENNLHPRLLELLVETFDRVQIEAGDRASQVLVTTHSSYLVDLMKPEDVVFVEKKEGATRCTRAEDRENLRRMLEESEMSLGRLWYSGVLGGV